jgi:hypothetical protein
MNLKGLSKFLLTILITSATPLPGKEKKTEQLIPYRNVAFYVCAHQDDWQLFMGADAMNDIRDNDEQKDPASGTKVVFIYTTAGNLNDTDDTHTCDCHDTHTRNKKKLAYWQVREYGARNSVHLAACKTGGNAPGRTYPKSNTVTINGHSITRYEFRNTVSYFLRIRSGRYGYWYTNEQEEVGTVDHMATYTGSKDLEQTIAEIYRQEAGITKGISFHMPDADEQTNPNDHHDHIIAGRAAMAAARSFSLQSATGFPAHLYIDYHTQTLPANLSEGDAQNEAALTAVYCLALLDYNAWPEWGTEYQKWTNRNYKRTVQTR